MRFLWLGVTIPSALTDVSMVQFTTTMAYDNLKQTDVYNSGAKLRRSVIIRRTKYQELWKGFFLNCCDFFYAEDFVGRIGIMFNFTPLRSPDIFITMRQEVRKGKSWGGTSMRASKRTLWVFTACKQMKNQGTKCAFVLVALWPTVVQSSFHTEFLSSIGLSPLRLLRRRK